LHLREGFGDDGQRSFTSFQLTWQSLGVPDGAACINYYSPHHAAGASKLRRWLLTGDARALLAVIAGAHGRLLENGKNNPADIILAAAASAQDITSFESIAARIG